MMKKVLLLLMVLVGYSAFFGTEANAKSISANTGLTKARIYINPGHGSWGGEDRHMGTVGHGGPTYTDTCGFFESNTNLEKGFGMLEKLIEYGVPFDRNKNKSNSNKARLGAALDLSQTNIVMSRVKNGPYPHDGSTYNAYSRNLSEIAAECESWNADVMISIHSNAITEGTNTNYPLFLYRGYTGSNQNGGSQAIASACWSYVWENTHMMWTYYSATNKNIQGDWTFASQWGTDGYGVLRHSVPGFLVEGYFHTYQPARHKAMNWDVCRIEGAGYAKGFRDYFGAGNAVGTGDIYGILRDGENTFSHTYYTPNMNTDDKYKPINNAIVQLKKTDGTVVQTYKTDDEYNGAFVFNKVAPGTYNIVCSHPDYADVTTSVTVTADKVVYPSVKMTQGEQIPVQGHYAYDLSMTQSGDDYTLKFKSTGAVDKGYIIFTNKSTGAKQSISIGKVVAGENSKTINAYDLGVTAAFSWAVALDNPRSSGIQLIKEDNSIIYTHSSGYMARIGLAIDKDPESANFGKFYTLTAFSQGLQTFNQDLSKDGSKVKIGTFGQDTDGSTSNYKYIRSNRINVNSGKVYIANYANQNYGVWVHTPGTTTSSQIIGTNYDRAVGFKGTGSNRQMYVMHEKTDNSNLGVRYYNIGTSDTWAAGSNSPSGSLESTLLANGDGDLIVTSKGVFASQWRAGTNTSTAPAFVFYNNSNDLVYNSSTLSTLSGTHRGGIAINNSLSTFAIVESPVNTGEDVEVEIYSVTWSGETPSFAYQYTIYLSGTKLIDQMAFDQADNLYIASQQKGLLVYTIKNSARQTVTPAKASHVVNGLEKPAVPGYYAYDLTMTQTADSYTLKFKSTGAVENANIVFTNKANGETKKYALEGVVKGENSVIVNAYYFEEVADFTWAVEFENPANPTIELLHSDNDIVYNDGSNNARIGVAIDKDPESANFGKIYTITSMGKGLQKFNPDLSKDGSWLITGKFGQDLSTSTSANKYVRSNRLEIYKGKVYIANYASDYTGIWEYDPVAGSEPTNLSGTTYYERGVAFYGEGSNRKVFSLHENNVQRFDIGTSNTWTSGSPTKEHTAAGVLDNGDGDIIVTDNAVIAAQTRYAGNNVSVNPAFVVFDHDLNLICKSDNLSSTLNGSENGGMALSADKSTFAIVNSYNGSGNNGVRIQVYSVTWNGSTPSFSHLYEIPLEGTYRVDQMDFDYAGNLYIASQQKGLLVYAIKCDARTTTTAAKSSLVVSGKVVPGVEGHFAYDLEMEETDYSYILKFKSTGAVESAKIVFEETENTKTTNISEKEIGAVVKGDNSIELIKADLPYGTQTWAVVFENAVSESVELMKTDNSVAFENKAQGGVAIDKDTESANFGKIYTVTAYAKGLQAFDAEMNPVGDRLFTGDPFGDSWYSPYRVEANSGKLYITDWIDDRSGVYVYDPNAETPSAPNMFKGDRKDISDDDKGLLVNEENVTVGCNVSSVEFVGEGENRKMYAFAEDAVNGAPRSSLLRYDLGTADTWAVAPSAVFSSMSSLLSTKDVVLLATDGGIFCAQKSEASNTAEKPAFVYVDFVGNIVFNSSVLTDLNGSKSGAIAMFGNNFAIANADGNIEVYKVAWNENVPSFSNKYTIKLNNTTEITQMEFDIAGNLYAFSVQEGLMKFAIKNEARATRTDAKAELQLVSSILTAIESVEVAAPVEYYNLQGIKVENPSNGVFIKLQGSKASKVVL